MHRQRRKQTAEVYELELSLLRADCPNLAAYSAQHYQLFQDSVLYTFLDSLKTDGSRRVKNLGKDPNACLRGFYMFCLKSIYDCNNKQLLERFKQELYSNERNLTAVTSLPDQYMELSSNQMKKLMVEFIHVLSYSSEKNKVEIYLNKYPVIETVMLLLMRAILRDCKIPNADEYNKPVDWIEAFLVLGQIFDIELRFMRKMSVCDFVGKRFYLVSENETVFMVYFDMTKTELIDLNDLEFDSVSVSQPSEGRDRVIHRVMQSDGSTPKFKLYIDSQRKKRRSQKNSFGGEIDQKAHQGLFSSTIINMETAFGDVIRKHRLSEAGDDNQSAKFQRKLSRKKSKSRQTEKNSSQKQSKGNEKVVGSPGGPRFLESCDPIELDLSNSQISQGYPSPQTPNPPISQPRILNWAQRSTFSQHDRGRINQKISSLFPGLPNSAIPFDTVSIEPNSPTNTGFSVQPNFERKNVVNRQSINIDSEMTCSTIIEMLEPSVRDSLRKRKMSAQTVESGLALGFQQKSSLIVDRPLQKEGISTFNIVMTESMVNVVNRPHQTKQQDKATMQKSNKQTVTIKLGQSKNTEEPENTIKRVFRPAESGKLPLQAQPLQCSQTKNTFPQFKVPECRTPTSTSHLRSNTTAQPMYLGTFPESPTHKQAIKPSWGYQASSMSALPRPAYIQSDGFMRETVPSQGYRLEIRELPMAGQRGQAAGFQIMKKQQYVEVMKQQR